MKKYSYLALREITLKVPLPYSRVLQYSLQRQQQQAIQSWHTLVPLPTLSLELVTTDLTRSLQGLGVLSSLWDPEH